jgi:nitroreductase
MNEVFKAIKGRRSIRRFTPEQIKDEELSLILEAGIYAPSGHNDQPWHFTVIQSKEVIDGINERSKARMRDANTDWIRKMGESEKYHVLHNAPTVIIVSGEELDNAELAYCPMADCSAAIQNMLLAAHSIGIASCWVGLTSFIFEAKDELEELNIPQGYKPMFAVVLGYSAITKEINPLPRRENVVNFIR